jgi:hypothetical protein
VLKAYRLITFNDLLDAAAAVTLDASTGQAVTAQDVAGNVVRLAVDLPSIV